MIAEVVAAGVERFVAAELSGFEPDGHGTGPSHLVAGPAPAGGVPQPVDLAAIGTTAPAAVQGSLLAQALEEGGYERRRATAWEGPDQLFATPGWQLGVVLSPWKRAIGAHCGALAPSAAATGVVDSVLRSPAGTVGFNTNTWAALSALEVLTAGVPARRVLLLGAGASARSVALAVTRAWTECELVVAARSPEAVDELLAHVAGRPFDPLRDHGSSGEAPEVIVNTTTWGETDASEEEPFAIDLDGVLRPGARLFDLNNRIGSLPRRALSSGCAVLSGNVMQRVTNACRVALLGYARPMDTTG